MKQLLQVTEDGFVIVALGDRVFAGGRLVRPDEGGDGGSGGSSSRTCLFMELDPSSLEEENGEASEKSKGNDCASSPLEVQAVAAVTRTTTTTEAGAEKTVLYCAVTRFDKSLCVYEIDTSPTTSAGARGGKKRYQPISVYKTTKRSGCLCFATVDAAASTATPTTAGGVVVKDALTVVIAGDLAGEAVAFPLAKSSSSKSNNSNECPEKEETQHGDGRESRDNDVGDDVDDKNRRLLLGHTASMLTSVKVVRDGGKSRILTSDRDEKVRVTSFPNTFIIEGFLLGHEAFVSSMDAATRDGVTRCATCGGDGTVRLWDYSNFEELASVSVNDDIPEDGKEAATDGAAKGKLTPSRVVMTSNGTRMLVLFDECPTVNVYDNTEQPKQRLRRCATFQCPSNTLGISVLPDDDTVLVLLTSAPYLQAYRIGFNKADGDVACDTVPSCSYPFLDTLLQEISVSGSSAIRMPSTVLEKDKSGDVKLKKISESRGPANQDELPWNNIKRRETARNRNKRRRQRKREEHRQAKRANGASSDAR